MKLLKLFINFLKGIWNVLKSMGNWKGVLSLIITWLILSGSGLILLGFILAMPKLTILGTAIYGFWLLPFTPLILVNIAFAMIVQKFIFRDKSVSIESIKEQFRKVKDKDDGNKDI